MAETQVINGPLTVRSRLTLGGGIVDVNPTIYTASGALTILPGKHLLSGAGVLVMTLAQPTAAQEGYIMTIYGDTPAAHTVTAADGWGSDPLLAVGTFDADAKAVLVVMAVTLNWCVLSNVGVVLS